MSLALLVVAAVRIEGRSKARCVRHGAGSGERFRATADLSETPLGVASLPHHHSDPFDRLLVAQAHLEGTQLVSRDEAFAPYDIDVLW